MRFSKIESVGVERIGFERYRGWRSQPEIKVCGEGGCLEVFSQGSTTPFAHAKAVKLLQWRVIRKANASAE